MFLGFDKHNFAEIQSLWQIVTWPNNQLLSGGILLGRVRLGIFRNKNVFRNIFRLFCSWEQNSQNEFQVFRNENSSQTNAYSHDSNYSYSGLIPNERALSHILHPI